jgi:uncharacterized protein (DUF1015 family)
VVSTEEARAYARDNPRSFFHISRPEIDLPLGTDEHSEAVYERGRRNLDAFRSHSWLVQDPEPRLYLYQQRMGNHAQIGVVAAASVDEYDQGQIKKHERTRPDKEDDRTRHIEALGGNDEPVFLTYRADEKIDEVVSELVEADPEYDFVSEDQVAHTFWLVPVPQTSKLLQLFRRVPALYVADGHHRSAAASRVKALHAGNGSGGGERDRFLAVIFPHSQMQILDYNRVVKDLRGLTPMQLVEKLRTKFMVSSAPRPRPGAPHQFTMFLEGKWYRLTARSGSFEDTPTGALDVSILQNNALAPLLGVGDPRIDKRINFVGGIRGTEKLETLVRSGQYQVAFCLYPTSVEQVMAIADTGDVLPPKSTWFEPKLRSGLVLHLFD